MRFVPEKMRVCAALIGVAAALSPACSCQRQENIEAKARLSQPVPPAAGVLRATETVDAEGASDPTVFQRILSMDAKEVGARLNADAPGYTFTSSFEAKFSRGDGSVKASEQTQVVVAQNGNFAVNTSAGDGSEQKLVFVAPDFFLKNNNGHFRKSRDPVGERDIHLTDALGVASAVVDVYRSKLSVQKIGGGTHQGRSTVRYKLAATDDSAAAASAGTSVPQPPPAVMNDAGVPEEVEPQPAKQKRIQERLSLWRERTFPAGGSGEMAVDQQTGVLLFLKYEGEVAVADGPSPSRLHLKVEHSFQPGKVPSIVAPTDAIEDVLRLKMPVQPRALLEAEGIVPPLPKDEKSGADTPRAAAKKKSAGDIPDDDSP